MMQFVRFLNQILLLYIFIFSITNANAAVNYKLTSVFYGNGGWTMNEIGNLSSWLGKRQTVIVLFTTWCNASMDTFFDIQIHNIWNNNSIPLITWQFFGCNGSSQPGIMKLVRNNTYDTYINRFGDRLKMWLAGNDGILGNNDDRRAYLRLGHEMNGNWYPWSRNSTPTDYVLSWRHVHDILSNKSLDSTRLQWIWCVNRDDVGNYTAEEYWVGDNYVDWLGIDGYNSGAAHSWTTWVWPNQIFDSMIKRLRRLSSTKPLSINEYGSSSIAAKDVSNIQNKTEWLNQFCDYIKNSEIKMASYFNIDKEKDWAIFDGLNGDVVWNNLNAYSAYKNCLQSDEWIQPDSTNERIITDDQFAGRF